MLKIVEIEDEDGRLPRSQASLAYARIKANILIGRVAPEEKLKINDLADALGVSPGAVREALSRLVPEGYVVSRDQKGFVVAPLSMEDLFDLTRLRCDIEALILRRSVAEGDEAWEASVLAADHQLRRTPRVVEGLLNPDWVARHELFHRALVGGCKSPRLQALRSHLYDQSERYRNLSLYLEGERNVDDEHRSLVDAALARDADELVRCATAHIQLTCSLIAEARRKSDAGAR